MTKLTLSERIKQAADKIREMSERLLKEVEQVGDTSENQRLSK